ncbi:NUDIX domain-containing protein [Qipengyuania sp. 6B39]|uniref:NUDIX domain-containing protein n=1 Tax=Qipengyuania proteolytica TaxID=2867239 RepID=UPI001C8AE2E2|nr:NUDIX domain-containing protein [Qipengyuania proteolytica]MBX7496935.1 NUDIX domain-containing protein [Qipengyuania proteolytica]
MLRLIPAPLYRTALRIAHRLRHHWRKWRGVTGEGVSVIARDLDGQILLVRHSYGPAGWYFPGGGIGRKETPEDAARRELREETDCAVEGLRLLGVIEEELSGAPHRAHIFDGVVDDMPRPDGREVIEARFFPVHSLPEPLGPRTRARLALWQARRT